MKKPVIDAQTAAVLAALIKECGDLASAATHCSMWGFDDKQPKTGKPNDKWLVDKMADVMAIIQLVDNTTDRLPMVSNRRVNSRYDAEMKRLRIKLEKVERD